LILTTLPIPILLLGFFGFRALNRPAEASSAGNPNPQGLALVRPTTVRSVDHMLSGVPQSGIMLGSPNAKLTLTEFAEPQCPYCGVWARTVFPTLVRHYVRTGQLRIRYEGLGFISQDSVGLLKLAQAAGLQNKLWNVAELEYENQGEERSGYATLAYLRAIANGVPGLDATKALQLSWTNTVMPPINEADALANSTLKDVTTPAFLIGPTGAPATTTISGPFDLTSFTSAIETELHK
jgi:protein-disulfide isomerase